MSENIVNQKFGKLLVLYLYKALKINYAKCECECGIQKSVRVYNLKNGYSTTCGYCRYPNLIGFKIGKLTVIEMSEPPQHLKQKQQKFWKCICECGGKTILSSSKLLVRKTQSCGCLEAVKPHTDVNKCIYASAKEVFKSVYNDGDLTLDKFIDLSQKDCFYCDLPAKQSNCNNAYNHIKDSGDFSKINGNFYYNGLDRIDSSLLHNLNNIVTCCKICNSFKSNRILDDFFNHINKLIINPEILTIYQLDNLYKIPILNDIKMQRNFIKNIFPARDFKNVLFIFKRINGIRSGAKQRCIEFNLSVREATILVSSNCIYCRTPANPSNGIFNGIDRIDNNLGYNIGNCVPCCKYCNLTKNANTLENFLNWIKRIKLYQHELHKYKNFNDSGNCSKTNNS